MTTIQIEIAARDEKYCGGCCWFQHAIESEDVFAGCGVFDCDLLFDEAIDEGLRCKECVAAEVKPKKICTSESDCGAAKTEGGE